MSELLTIRKHSTKANQQILVYKYKNYCWAVPCIFERDIIFLKTAYPSRKFTKIYLNQE